MSLGTILRPLLQKGRLVDSLPTNVESLIKRADLPSLPDVLLAIYQVLGDDASDADRVAQLLKGDPALAARTLQLANSAYYRGTGHHADLALAVVRIGPVKLWQLLVSTTIRLHFTAIPTDRVDMFSFWRHSLYTACLGEAIAIRERLGDRDLIYLSGLLHDVGKLIFLTAIPLDYEKVLFEPQSGHALVTAEKEQFGFCHAALGAGLLKYWELPPLIAECVRCHHEAERNPSESTRAVLMANDLCHHMLDNRPLGQPEHWKEIDTVQIIDSASTEYDKTAELFGLN